MSPRLTREEQVVAFKSATRSLMYWHADEIAQGVPDERLEELLARSLGIFGGSSGPNRLSICFQGSGLKIWARRKTVNHVQDRPILQGKATLKMAREVYGIPDPSDDQLKLI